MHDVALVQESQIERADVVAYDRGGEALADQIAIHDVGEPFEDVALFVGRKHRLRLAVIHRKADAAHTPECAVERGFVDGVRDLLRAFKLLNLAMVSVLLILPGGLMPAAMCSRARPGVRCRLFLCQERV